MINDKNTTQGRQVHLFTVPNTFEGVKQIADLRRSIHQSKTGHRIILYGRGQRFGKGRHHVCKCVSTGQYGPRNCGCGWWDNRFQSQVPIKIADKIAVYIKSGHWSNKH